MLCLYRIKTSLSLYIVWSGFYNKILNYLRCIPSCEKYLGERGSVNFENHGQQKESIANKTKCFYIIIGRAVLFPPQGIRLNAAPSTPAVMFPYLKLLQSCSTILNFMSFPYFIYLDSLCKQYYILTIKLQGSENQSIRWLHRYSEYLLHQDDQGSSAGAKSAGLIGKHGNTLI